MFMVRKKSDYFMAFTRARERRDSFGSPAVPEREKELSLALETRNLAELAE